MSIMMNNFDNMMYILLNAELTIHVANTHDRSYA